MPRKKKIPFESILDLSKYALKEYLGYLTKRRRKRPSETDTEYEAYLAELKGFLSVDQADFVRKLMVNVYHFTQEEAAFNDGSDPLRGMSSAEIEEKILNMGAA
ncbi:MAG: hypothetical protein JW940_04480 [Polyangiaceae bacterium]|nr:hypothetical protein [Polyangiaceae bacterium]